MTFRLNDGIISDSMKNEKKYQGNLAKGSPVIKKFNFFCFLLDTSRVSISGRRNYS